MAWVQGAKDLPSDNPKSGGGCCRGMARFWLVIFNIFFMMLGGGIIAIGVLLRFNSQLFETYVMDIMTSAEVDGMNLKTILESVSIAFILVGVIIAVFAIIGLIGACCTVKKLLTIYALIMLKIIILQIVALVLMLVFRGEIDSKIKGALQATLDTYKGYNSTEPVTIGWNYIFSKFECCGIDNHTDLDTATSWPQSVTYAGISYSLEAPIFCCKMEGTYPTMTLPADANCAQSPNSTTSNYMRGCYQAVEDYIMTYKTTLIIICAFLFACEIVNIITAIMVRQGVVAKENAKKKQHKRQLRAWKRTNKVEDGE